ncbi:hypothetical protein A6E15_18965 [Natrinema saccharevitans]|uniref:Uncharacterized protein n=1 Tax=Natrinema saccharevitans TaxID=301967 RepID=A0A1S8AS25_9EURY|nr:hypothetical protein [Natrinema saccharevitans]OLZ39442.1 hypothetical protein A6E15_18965 [Natrinema saccharevitans]
MPYLDPELILDRFAAFTREEVRPAVTDDEFVHAQVGSMASTLQFLAGDVGGREAAVRVQRRTLRERPDRTRVGTRSTRRRLVGSANCRSTTLGATSRPQTDRRETSRRRWWPSRTTS